MEVVKIRDEATIDYWNEISADALSGLDRHWGCRRAGWDCWNITNELAEAVIHKLCNMDVVWPRSLDGDPIGFLDVLPLTNLSPIDVIEHAPRYASEKRGRDTQRGIVGWHEGMDSDKIKIVNIDGIEYQHYTEDETMIRREDFKEVGVWNMKTKEIDFEDEACGEDPRDWSNCEQE